MEQVDPSFGREEDQVQEVIPGVGEWREDRVARVPARVRREDERRATGKRGPVRVDARHLDRRELVAGPLERGRQGEPGPAEEALEHRVDVRHDTRVEPDAGADERHPARRRPDRQRPGRRRGEKLRRRLGALPEAELPGDDVRRPRRQDRERHVAPDERARRLGDGPVAPADGDEVRLVREPLRDELGGVAGPLGRQERENDAAPASALGERGHLRGPVASSRRRVVDEEAVPHTEPSKSGPVAVLGERPRCR